MVIKEQIVKVIILNHVRVVLVCKFNLKFIFCLDLFLEIMVHVQLHQ